MNIQVNISTSKELESQLLQVRLMYEVRERLRGIEMWIGNFNDGHDRVEYRVKGQL